MLNPGRFEKQLRFLVEIDQVKQVLRNTILMDASRRENDAEHTWHMAVCALLFKEYANEPNLDLLKVVKMILLHDLVEIDAGDTFAYDAAGSSTQTAREQQAAARIFGLLPEDQKNEFKALWEEFEAAQTPESQYAHAIDTFMPILHNYQTQGLQWRRFKVTSDQVRQRNQVKIKKGSKVLAEYIETLLKDAVENGYLQR